MHVSVLVGSIIKNRGNRPRRTKSRQKENPKRTKKSHKNEKRNRYAKCHCRNEIPTKRKLLKNEKNWHENPTSDHFNFKFQIPNSLSAPLKQKKYNITQITHRNAEI